MPTGAYEDAHVWRKSARDNHGWRYCRMARRSNRTGYRLRVDRRLHHWSGRGLYWKLAPAAARRPHWGWYGGGDCECHDRRDAAVVLAQSNPRFRSLRWQKLVDALNMPIAKGPSQHGWDSLQVAAIGALRLRLCEALSAR